MCNLNKISLITTCCLLFTHCNSDLKMNNMKSQNEFIEEIKKEEVTIHHLETQIINLKIENEKYKQSLKEKDNQIRFLKKELDCFVREMIHTTEFIESQF